MNLAVGGDWPGNPDNTTPNPADMLVDYVRVYKIPSVPAPSIQWQPVQVKTGSAVASIMTLHAQNYLVLQLYFVRMQEKQQRSGPEGPSHSLYFRVLKHPAPSGIFDLQL
jgi:beta-glucanase (GH16 family)